MSLSTGAMRADHHSYKRLVHDLEVLGWRHRRFHDLRRTFISLARTDGAVKDILERCTHTPGSRAAVDMYTSFSWETLCREVAKLRIEVRSPVEPSLAPLPGPTQPDIDQPPRPDFSEGSESQPLQPEIPTAGTGTVAATVGAESASGCDVAWWRRRGSNPRPKDVHDEPLHA